MKSNKITRLFCVLLSGIMLVMSLASCSGTEKKPKLPDKVALEHVYTTKYFDSSDEDIEVNNVTYVGGKLYGWTTEWKEPEEGKTDYYSSTAIYNIDLNDGSYTELVRFDGTSEYDNGKGYEDRYDSFYTLDDETFFCMHNVSSYDNTDPDNYVYENASSMAIVNAEGNTLVERKIKDVLPDMEYFYPSYVVDGALGGNLMIFCENNAYIFDHELNLKNTVDGMGDQSYVNNVRRTGDGDIVVLAESWSQSGDTYSNNLYVFNEETLKFDKLESASLDGVYRMFGAPGSAVYYSNAIGVFSYNIETGETEEVLNWLNSDINQNRVFSLCPIDDGRFFLGEYKKNHEGRKTGILSPVGDGASVEKYVINFASVWLDDDLNDMIISFNKQNEEYRICIKDYFSSEDYDSRIDALNQDILAGNIPDIISLAELDFDTYASKGVLADLGALMDKDSSFKREDYLENILDACKYKGKILSVIPSFNLLTYIAKEENVGDITSWTMKDLDALRSKYPDASVFQEVTRSDLLSSFCNMAIKGYIDYDKGTCNFDTENFYRFLELVKELPEEINYDDLPEEYWEQYDSAFRENRALIRQLYLSDYDLSYIYSNFGGPVSFVGLPVDEGSGAAVYPTMELAISASSPFTDVCWDFIKYVLSEENQTSTYQFPILRSALDKKAQSAIENSENNYDDGGFETGVVVYEEKIIADPIYSDGQFKVDRNMIDKVNAAIASATNVSRSGSAEYKEFYKIIEEETGAFFAGQKSAQDVAKTIQSRIKLVIQERY